MFCASVAYPIQKDGTFDFDYFAKKTCSEDIELRWCELRLSYDSRSSHQRSLIPFPGLVADIMLDLGLIVIEVTDGIVDLRQ